MQGDVLPVLEPVVGIRAELLLWSFYGKCPCSYTFIYAKSSARKTFQRKINYKIPSQYGTGESY
jgi:hypothetical protein